VQYWAERDTGPGHSKTVVFIEFIALFEEVQNRDEGEEFGSCGCEGMCVSVCMCECVSVCVCMYECVCVGVCGYVWV